MRLLVPFKILKKEIRAFPQVLKCFIAAHFFKKVTIVVSAWVKTNKKQLLHNNWGDDINIFFIEMVTHKKVLILPQTRFAFMLPMKTYVLIGSCIEYAKKKYSIVYGSGLMNDEIYEDPPSRTSKILSVRGPLTREWLLKHGINCPEKYGDPALLLSCFYKPRIQKKYKISYVPHHMEYEENKEFLDFLKEKGIHIIKVMDYKEWTDFIDEIIASEFVISSSLHGLIVSETYNIPSVWSQSIIQRKGFEFKYYDFYQSIGKNNMNPILFNKETDFDSLMFYKDEWKPGNIDYKDMINTFPLDIKVNYSIPK